MKDLDLATKVREMCEEAGVDFLFAAEGQLEFSITNDTDLEEIVEQFHVNDN